MPNVPGAPLGAINYEKQYVREKITNQFDIKLTYQAAASDNLSVRYSRQSSASFDQGTFGENGIWGGVKDYAGSGTQPSYNYSANYNRVWSSTLIQEIRTGQSYYRNITITDAHRMNLADEIGIPGANLTPFTSGAPTINIPAYHAFLLGTQNSLPWDRAKRTTNLSTNVTKIWGNHTLKVGGDFRMTNDFLDQVAHPRGELTFTGAMTAIPTDSAAQNGYANQMAAFLLDVPGRSSEASPWWPMWDSRWTSRTAVDATRPSGPTSTTSGRCAPTSPSTSASATSTTRPWWGFTARAAWSTTTRRPTSSWWRATAPFPRIWAYRATGRTSSRARASPGASTTRTSCARAMA